MLEALAQTQRLLAENNLAPLRSIIEGELAAFDDQVSIRGCEIILTPEAAPAAGELLVASEYLVEDVNSFASLARRREPVGS